MKKTLILIIMILIYILLVMPISAKTLTNKDVEDAKKGVNKGVPTYNPMPAVKDVPNVPSDSGSGVPTVPPLGGGATKTVSGGAVIVKKHLPYQEWESEYKNYFQSHYNDDSLILKPKMIALHYSGTATFAQLWWTFVNGGLYENTRGHLSVHFVVDRDGTIYELMPLNRRARGTYGVNHVAVSIDLIGINEQQILNNPKQLKTSFALIRWLMKTYKIPKEKVLAHTEIAQGKEIIPEYTDYYDKQSPDRYPADARTRGPGKAYMFKLRYYLLENGGML